MTNSANLSLAINTKVSIDAGSFLGEYRNKLINGDVRFWQRGTSFSGVGYAADRWYASHNGTTKQVSQQTFTPGQNIVPGNPIYYMRHVVSSSAGSANYCAVQQRIEWIQYLSGKTVTVTFWAKADANRNIATEINQVFGTGGSPSTFVPNIGTTTCALTTSWQKFSYVVNIPSILGSTLGTNGDYYTSLIFWLDAGSSFNSRTNSLGQQSGTFDIAHVSIVENDCTNEYDPFGYRSTQQELDMCERFFQTATVNINAYNTAGNYVGIMWQPQTLMRSVPAATITGTSGNNASNIVVSPFNNNSIEVVGQATATGWTKIQATFTLDAEL